MGQVVTSGDTDGKPTDPPPPSASPGPAGPSPAHRRKHPQPATPGLNGTAPTRRRKRPQPPPQRVSASDASTVIPADAAPDPQSPPRRVGASDAYPLEFALSEFVPDAGAELDPKGRGVNRHRVDFDAQEAQSLYRPLHPDLIVARV